MTKSRAMQADRYCQLLLTCRDVDEADKIAKVLLQQKLIVCVKQLAVSSEFLWHGDINHNDEVLLMMDSREDLFDQVESEVAKLHTYDTFVLQAIPVTRTSKRALQWMAEELKDE
jgi:periplasmic divalent cation tolerance protein